MITDVFKSVTKLICVIIAVLYNFQLAFIIMIIFCTVMWFMDYVKSKMKRDLLLSQLKDEIFKNELEASRLLSRSIDAIEQLLLNYDQATDANSALFARKSALVSAHARLLESKSDLHALKFFIDEKLNELEKYL